MSSFLLKRLPTCFRVFASPGATAVLMKNGQQGQPEKSRKQNGEKKSPSNDFSGILGEKVSSAGDRNNSIRVSGRKELIS
ncbi:hypothetical protein AVEN_221228-1 [Araneus ventricosus]|uniref:Uncharacterized protein n=1 Tax=Araneus ventricosus TaxID=182803 RepID=A0A4Y2F3E9_ARAVE|nr:hypothetical protein AVEN_221228-1 [Araneus ventricosus]